MKLVNGAPPLRHLFFFVCLLPALNAYKSSTSLMRTTYIVHMDKSLMPKAFTHHRTLYSSVINSLKFTNPPSSIKYDQSSPSLIYAYSNDSSGFCALVSLHELEALKNSLGFVSAFEDGSFTLHTTHTPEFLSLNPSIGLWLASDYGNDVIVGVIDSGVWPEITSFKDSGMPTELPQKWKGRCEEGQRFISSLCNAKLIGARTWNLHASAIVAGNYVNDASFFGYGSGTAKGVAPRARLAVYKVSWHEGRYISDAVAGIYQAIFDGVDIISMSLSPEKIVPPHRDAFAKATFAAMEKGVLVSTSAGNIGRLGNEIVQNGYPWVLTVTAGTTDRWYAGSLTLENGLTIEGWTLFVGNVFNGTLHLLYDKRRLMCDEALSNVSDHGIIICHGYIPLSDQMKNVAKSPVQGAIFIANRSIQAEIGVRLLC
ncbi:Subtilisin-like protease [Morella rubra]|uniref:Subtilisin-like protease n=1 Tax=Morella rubra TaxID=262757 RepID=A0A6A1VT13_9ROSI|nr:Subtilisin-like protease [Morella rubra]KAB1216041.1 Subtilisin-like protease [Morella rubra]